MEMIRGRANTELNARKDRVSDTLDAVAHTMRRISEPLRDQPYPAVAGYAEGAAGRIEGLAAGLRQRDVLELADDLRGVARDRPGAFVAAGFAVGVLAARFLKSSAGAQGDSHATGPRGRRVTGSTTSQTGRASERW